MALVRRTAAARESVRGALLSVDRTRGRPLHRALVIAAARKTRSRILISDPSSFYDHRRGERTVEGSAAGPVDGEERPSQVQS